MKLIILTKAILILGAIFAVYLALGLFIPVGGGLPKGHALTLLNQSSVKGLEIAINGYRTEYNHSPSSLQSPGSENHFRSEGSLIKSLMAKDPTDNPRNIRFYDPSTHKKKSPGILPDPSLTRVVDSWGEAFYLLADTDNDGQVLNPEPGTNLPQISTRVLIYSSGPDKDPTTWKDNIKSWD